jgi:hypothetical protein
LGNSQIEVNPSACPIRRTSAVLTAINAFFRKDHC